MAGLDEPGLTLALRQLVSLSITSLPIFLFIFATDSVAF